MNQLELEYRGASGGKSQTDRVLRMLQSAHGDWVSMPDLARGSGSLNIHSRIADLRNRGYIVDPRQLRAADGTHLSFYRLVEKEI